MQQKAVGSRRGMTSKAVEGDFRFTIPLIFVATVTVFSNMYITQPVLPIIGAEFGLTPAQAGLTVSSLVLAIAGSSVFYGVLSDRVGRRPVMVFSVLGLVGPTLLCALSPGFIWLVIFRVGQGLLIPGFTAIAITYLQEEMPADRRAIALGYYVSATVAGGFFGRAVGGVVTDLADNWRLSFVSFGLVDLVVGYALWRWLPASRYFVGRATTNTAEGDASVVTSETPPPSRFRLGTVLVHLANRQLLSVYIVGFCLMYSFLGLFTYLPYYLSKPPFGLSTLLISSAYVVYLVGMFSAPFSARLARRIGRRTILRVGFLIMLVGVLMTLVPALPVVIAGLVVLCFGMFGCQSTATALVGESVRVSSARGSAVSLYQMFFYVGASVGGFVPGLLWQAGGWPPLTGGIVAAIGVGLAAITWLGRAT